MSLLQDAVVASGARGADGVVWAHKSCFHGQHCAAHVCDSEGNAEGVHFSVSCPNHIRRQKQVEQ